MFRNIPVENIVCNPEMNVSRGDFSPESCEELAQDIFQNGLSQPITVIPYSKGVFQVAIGFRRYTAMAVLLSWETIPCFIQQWTVEEAQLRNIGENIHRKDLSFWQECRALMDYFPHDKPVKEIAAELSVSQPWVRNRWLVNFPKEVVDQVEAGLLGPSHIGIIYEQKDNANRVQAANKLIQGQAEGKPIKELQRELTGRKNHRKKGEVIQLMTTVLENGAVTDEAAVHAMRYCIGEITDTLLLELLDKCRERV